MMLLPSVGEIDGENGERERNYEVVFSPPLVIGIYLFPQTITPRAEISNYIQFMYCSPLLLLHHPLPPNRIIAYSLTTSLNNIYII